MLGSGTESGRKRRVSDEALLRVFVEASAPVLSTAEVAEAIPIKRRGTFNRLETLEEHGLVESKEIGGRNRVWWLTVPEATADAITSDPSAEAGSSDPGEADGDDRIEGRTHDARQTTDGGREDLDELVRAHLGESDLPVETEHGRDAVVDIFRYLRAEGTAQTDAIRAAVTPSNAERFGSEEAMWRSIRPHLTEIPGIEKAGYGEYTYAGDIMTLRAVDNLSRSDSESDA